MDLFSFSMVAEIIDKSGGYLIDDLVQTIDD